MLAPPATTVKEALRHVPALRPEPSPIERVTHLAERLLKRRREFGITRVGSITRLDRIGLPVVQVVRPLSLSNCVSQGKGPTLAHAAVSALMEALETWAAERIPPSALFRGPASSLPDRVRHLTAASLVHGAPADWEDMALQWTEGWDLLTDQALPVPAALVDTVYTLPPPHPALFPRTTTGLGAGPTVTHAIVQAALEILERDAVAAAQRRPHFFDQHQIDLSCVRTGAASDLVERIRAAGLLAGAWRVPAPHPLPVYWCHVMEKEESEELVPLPAEGFGCATTHDSALAKALREACQARLTAISGAREDVTRRAYPSSYDREHLAEWRLFLDRPPRPIPIPAEGGATDGRKDLPLVLDALNVAGAAAAIAVPLFGDPAEGIHVVRLVAPPLRHGVPSERR